MDIRLTNNDPDFERIHGNRKARSLNFNAKVFFWIGLVPISLYGFGLLWWIIAQVLNIKANKLRYQYKE